MADGAEDTVALPASTSPPSDGNTVFTASIDARSAGVPLSDTDRAFCQTAKNTTRIAPMPATAIQSTMLLGGFLCCWSVAPQAAPVFAADDATDCSVLEVRPVGTGPAARTRVADCSGIGSAAGLETGTFDMG